MLVSGSKHLWSPNGIDWFQLQYAVKTPGGFIKLGGSASGAPMPELGDYRKFISNWGWEVAPGLQSNLFFLSGGCCSSTLFDATTDGGVYEEIAWGQPFSMAYGRKLSVTTQTPTKKTVPVPENTRRPSETANLPASTVTTTRKALATTKPPLTTTREINSTAAAKPQSTRSRATGRIVGIVLGFGLVTVCVIAVVLSKRGRVPCTGKRSHTVTISSPQAVQVAATGLSAAATPPLADEQPYMEVSRLSPSGGGP
jgi:hypothetical protein